MFTHRQKLRETRFYRALLIGMLLLMYVSAQTQTHSLNQCVDTALLYNRNIRLARQDGLIANEKNREVSADLIAKMNFRVFTEGGMDKATQANVKNMLSELKNK